MIDPEGDYRVLARLPGVTWARIEDRASLDEVLDRFRRDPAACVVADLSGPSYEQKLELIQAALGKIRDSRRRNGLPHWVILDEAHYALHQEGVAEAATGLEDKGFCLATYRPSWLRDSVVKAFDLFLLARTTAADELACLRRHLGPAPGAEAALAALPDLPEGEFMLIDPAGPGTPRTFMAPPRETAHVRHLRKYVDSRVPFPERFIFRGADGGDVGEARSLREFRRMVALTDERVLAHHAGHGDFSRWVLDVFSDRELARQLSKTEARWRRREIPDLRAALGRLITLRYGVDV